MKEYRVKISDELLSAVFGCECEFDMILKNDVVFRCENDRCNENVFYDEFHQCNLINLDTFIRLGKIWAFDNGYEVYQKCYETVIIEQSKKDEQRLWFREGKFKHNEILKALEWVVNEVIK